MSDKWRISGGLGEPEVVNQVMTQGLGFPLRPVDGTPATGVDFGDFVVAEGIFMQWMGTYQAGLLYPIGSVVLDGGWTMVANVHTVSKPAPEPQGTPAWAMSDTPTWGESESIAVVYSGHIYEFTESGWISGLRITVPELTGTTNYRVVIADITDPNSIVTSVINDPLLTEDAWKNVGLYNTLVVAGQKLLVYIDALNSGSDTFVTGGWNYNGTSGNAPVPTPGGWSRDNQNQTLRIDKTDLDLTDRSSELAGMIPGTNIQYASTDDPNRSITFLVNGAVVDGGTYFQYPVTLVNTGPSGQPAVGVTTTMSAAVPVAQSTKYVEAVTTPTPAWATVTPVLEYDGVDQSPGDVAFGVDINFDIAVVNTAWDIVATTEI